MPRRIGPCHPKEFLKSSIVPVHQQIGQACYCIILLRGPFAPRRWPPKVHATPELSLGPRGSSVLQSRVLPVPPCLDPASGRSFQAGSEAAHPKVSLAALLGSLSSPYLSCPDACRTDLVAGK